MTESQNERYEIILNRILNDDSVTPLLKKIIKEFDKRDVLDSLYDARLLVSLFEEKWQSLTNRSSEHGK